MGYGQPSRGCPRPTRKRPAASCLTFWFAQAWQAAGLFLAPSAGSLTPRLSSLCRFTYRPQFCPSIAWSSYGQAIALVGVLRFFQAHEQSRHCKDGQGMIRLRVKVTRGKTARDEITHDHRLRDRGPPPAICSRYLSTETRGKRAARSYSKAAMYAHLPADP